MIEELFYPCVSLYPVIYNEKKYYKKDCDDLFVDMYYSVMQLNEGCGVYLSDGVYIYPDGSIGE